MLEVGILIWFVWAMIDIVSENDAKKKRDKEYSKRCGYK